MNPYTTGMRNAITLANQIALLKGSRFLDTAESLTLDGNAFIPRINSWTRLVGFRAADAESSIKSLRCAAQQWIRAAHRSGIPAVYALRTDSAGTLSVDFGNMDAGILRSRLPDCHVRSSRWSADGFRFSGLMPGTLSAENIADTFAASGLSEAYIACVITPVADSTARDILAENRRLTARLTPYKSFQRVYGNASRRTVETPVREVAEALDILKNEEAFLRSRIPDGLVYAAIRFGANTRDAFLRLADIIQSGMTARSDTPGFEPTRCFALQGSFADWSACLAIPHIAIADANGARRDVFAVSFQGVTDAASFCTAPAHSYPGYYVDCAGIDDHARDLFPVVRAISGVGAVVLGKALNSTGSAVLPLDSMLAHTAVFGGTNTGKTNAVQKILGGAWEGHHIPFVVLEAAKKEYNAMLGAIPALRVFTAGADGEPLLMNPLQPEDGVLIERHADAVVRAISAATGAEHPIPEAFHGLLRRTYKRFGWDVGSMAYTDAAKPFPTFGDAFQDVDAYIAASARYGPEVRQNLTAALKLRCETFSSGTPGRLFAADALTARDFLGNPAVIELSDLPEENAAFLMNILLFKFQSYLERCPASGALNRLIVVEEAHNVFRKTLCEETSLARSNQAFDKMLAEIRASGTGLILSDQRPGVMPDSVLANTAVKICLGMDSEEDRRRLGDAMGLSEAQRRELHSFEAGECLVTIRGRRGIFHVQADKVTQPETWSAACLICSCRFRCRRAAVQRLVDALPAELTRYHLAKIAANPYNIPLLSANIDHMLADMHVTAAAPTRLCLLGILLRRANVPMRESRVIVNAYHVHLKEGQT